MVALPVDLPVNQAGVSPVGGLLPGRWTVWADRWNGEPLGPVQVTSANYSKKLSDVGEGNITLVVTDSSEMTGDLTDESPVDLTDLLRFWGIRWWLFYDGQPMWCGLHTSIQDTSRRTVSVKLVELPGYLTKRAYDPPTPVVRYNQVEQVEIARQIAAPLPDIGVTVTVDPGPGFMRDRSYTYLEGPTRADLLSNLSNVIDGPEYRMEYELDPASAQPRARLRIAYPRVGLAGNDIGFTVPGTALDPQITYDAELMRTRTFAVGDLPENAPQDTPKPSRMVDRPQPLMPRIDHIDDHPGVVLPETLLERANTSAGLHAGPVLTVKGSTFETDPPITSYDLGDDVNILVRDDLHQGGLALLGRLAGLDVDCDKGTVAWTVTTTSPPTLLQRTHKEQLRYISAQQAIMFRRSHGGITPT